jgi:hypothetical protein
MRKFLGSKIAIQVIGMLSVLVIIYMIASLDALQLKPARPFAVVQETNVAAPGEMPSWKGLGFVIVIFAVLMVVLFYFLSPEQRKKFLFGLALFLVVGLVLVLLISKVGLGKEVIPMPATQAGVVVTQALEPTVSPEVLVTPSEFTPPQVSPWTSYLVALVVLLGGVAVWVWLVWRKRKTDSHLDVLAEIARTALDEIDSGKDWGNAILNSYYRMNQAVADWRGIRRQAGMTPEEFAKYLVSTHLPGEAVFTLTKLFERVRYGNKHSNSSDIQEAVKCLTAILEFCQAGK